MADKRRWAWQALMVSGGIGFLALLTYLGRGYLDTWHGIATLFLLPVFTAAVLALFAAASGLLWAGRRSALV